MKTPVWPEYFHLLSSNANLNHGLCPKGSYSWCKFQKSVASNTEYDHSKHFHFPLVVMEKIKPIFKNLSESELLKKCLHGKSQNPNESVNQIIWSCLPKTVFVGINTLHLGVYDAANTFNKGNIVRSQVFKKLEMLVGKNFC